jgi:hypothetical protein
MTPKSFWAILLKILGIYIIFQMIAGVPQFLNLVNVARTIFYQNRIDINGGVVTNESDKLSIILMLGYSLGLILLYILMLYNCLFKPNRVIDKLKLDKGFEDERFEFNIHRSTVLKIIIMLTGAVMLVNDIPILFMDAIAYFQRANVFEKFTDNPQSKYIVAYSIRIFIGYFMLSCSRMIVNFIELKRKRRSQ